MTNAVDIRIGQCLQIMQQLPERSVHCCVTSPPYFGLRDYGTATWEGGDRKCDHNKPSRQGATGERASRVTVHDDAYRATCGKCGAKRIDDQLGLEATPEEYVANMVEVFREVRRVLRDDGTLWLNLGSSYAGSGKGGGGSYQDDGMCSSAGVKTSSGGINPNQSPLLRRVPACDSDDTEYQCCRCGGRVYPDSCDEPPVDNQIHHVGSVRNDQSSEPVSSPPSQTGRDSERLGSTASPPSASLPDVPRSTKQQSSSQPLDASCREDEASAFQKVQRTSYSDEHPSDNTKACTCDTFQMSSPLVVRIQGKESFFSACGRSDCKGVGNCGLCWCSLSIPSLTCKQKDMVPIPWMVAMALQADGWYLRQDIIWHKPNPMPESVTDRCTKAHEYIFLLSKSARYYFDAEAIQEDAARPGASATYAGQMRGGSTNWYEQNTAGMDCKVYDKRNKRSVWTVPTQSFKGAHFATFPEKLIEPCILAGCPPEGTVLDPFGGSGTTAVVAMKHGRSATLCELNPEYAEMASERAKASKTLFHIGLECPK